jgi:hypothetical protein
MNHFEKQQIILNQFESTIRKESKREEPTFLENLIDKSRQRKEAWEQRLQREKKEEIRYTHYRPTHYKTQIL